MPNQYCFCGSQHAAPCFPPDATCPCSPDCTRRFEKTIRYASRKAYAEVRPRIKGRFATKEEVAAMKAAEAAMKGGVAGAVGGIAAGDAFKASDSLVPVL